MKAVSCGLETRIRLSEKQIEQLAQVPISGILKFRENYPEFLEKDIPFILDVKFSQMMPVEVEIFPSKTYFGKADKIKFHINGIYYESLKEEGYETNRFCFGVGKLEITNSERIKKFF